MLRHHQKPAALARLLAFALSLLLAACGGGSDSSPPPPPPAVGSATIGAAGGTVDGPDGVRLAIAPGAVATNTTFRIARDASGAPPLEGLNAVSPIYAVTPHGTTFEGQAEFSIPLSAATLPAGATPILLKAETGGRWRVLNADTRRANALAADVGELSFFVLATCTSTGQQQGWLIDTAACPDQHSMKLELLSSGGTPVVVTPGATPTQPPTVTVTGPTTLDMRLVWTRAPGTTRTDEIAVTGSPGGFSAASGFASTWTGVEAVNATTFRNFIVTIDPARISGAGNPGGRLLRINAYATYSTTVFLIGRGNVPAGFEFTTSMPIIVKHLGTQPQITQQPTPDAVSVVEGASFSLQAQASGAGLTLQWRYLAGSVDAAAEGVNDQPAYQSPPALLAWNGRAYYLRACSTTGSPAVTTCVNSLASPLTVSAFTQPIAFTSQPASRDIIEGQGTTFGATVTGTPTPTLRWLVGATCRVLIANIRTCSGTPLADGAGTGVLQGATISGSGTATLALAAVPISANGATLVLEAAQPGGLKQWSDLVTLTVRAAPVPAGFAQQLASPRTVEQGGTVDFTVVVTGTQPINYAWTISGGQPLTPGRLMSGPCTDAQVSFPAPGTLRLANVPLGCDGSTIAVGIDNVATPAGTRPTSTALLNVTAAAPVFTQQPAAMSVDALQATTPATFSFAVRGASGAFAWQWLVNGQPLADGSNIAGNGVLDVATVQGASGSVADGSNGVSGALTLAQLPLSANGAALSVRVTRTSNAQTYTATSNTAALGVSTTLPPNALTATQVLAGHEWSMVLRSDRTLWAWGGLHKLDGTVQIANMNPADLATRPVRMYPAVLNDVQQIAGWYDGFWALVGTPGSDASQVLQWGNARAGTDGRGGDGNGGMNVAVPTLRSNAAPVPLLEQRTVNGNLVVLPANRVCSFAVTDMRLLMIRALDELGQPTSCAPGAAKTLWVAGTLTQYASDSYGLVVRAPGVSGSPPARVFATQTTGAPGGAIVVLEDGRAFMWGDNIGNRFGLPVSPTNTHLNFQGNRTGPAELPAQWGVAREFAFTWVGLFGLRTDGSVAVSGRNDSMELALGPQPNSTVNDGPLAALSAAGVPLTGVQALAATTQQMSLALIGGRIYTWGYGVGGSFSSLRGAGTTTNSGYPILLPTTNGPNSGWQALSASYLHGLVIGPGGAVYAWGYGLRGALGDGVSGSTALEPKLVTVP